MAITKALAAPLTYRLWRPEHWRLVLRDVHRPASAPLHDRRRHMEAAVDWLCRAQDRRQGEPDAGGVSAGWSFEDGWLPSYPETSGYIVETFLAAAQVHRRDDLRERAGAILDWELSIQLNDGSFPGHFGEADSRPVIFNTGQIMHGLVAGFRGLGRDECLEAAVQAGRWMVASQDPDGCWRRNVHNDILHVYNTRAAWALLRTGIAAGDSALRDAAERNVRWALTQQTDAGWLRQNAFTRGAVPYTHTIAYALRGILECGVLLGAPEMVQAARRGADGLFGRLRADGWLAGTFDDGWIPRAGYCCLTGLAQSVLVWQRLQHVEEHRDYAGAIDRALGYLQRNHYLLGDGSPADGGIAGSVPIWGAYSRFEYPNWAAKFYVDALLMDLTDRVVPPVHGAQGTP